MEDSGLLREKDGILSEYFTLESHLTSTRSADAYSALHKARNVNVCLWMLKHPLAIGSESVQRFLSRMQTIKDLNSHLCPLLEFGVDSTGMAYAVLPSLDGQPITAGLRDSTEAERRLAACVRLVEKLHAVGVVCGDICASSFWCDRSGDIWLTGVMGAFDSGAAETAAMPSIETLHYLAPEQRSGGISEKASDVFALGVLGYYLLTGKYPYGEDPAMFMLNLSIENIKPLSTYNPMAPAWGDQVLVRCLNPVPEQRYASAGAIIAGVADMRKGGQPQTRLPVKSRNEILLKRTAGSSKGTTENKETQVKKAGSDLLQPRIIVAALIIFVISLGIASKRLISRNAEPESVTTSAPLNATVPDELVPRLDGLGKDQDAQQQLVIKKLDELVKSNDPLAYDMLVRSAVEAAVPELRSISEKALIDKARRNGMVRSAEQLKLWLRTVPTGEPPASYEPLLRALNPAQPSKARDALLREAYAANPKVAMRFAAAMALDSNKVEDFHTVLVQMETDSQSVADANKHSVLGLILADSELALIFGEDVVTRKAEVPDSDLEWLLKVLADRNDLNVRVFANLAVEKGVLSPLRRSLLSEVSEREDLPSDVMNALVRAGAGAFTAEDAMAFGRWYDSQSESVLLAICADANDPKVLSEAFDVLTGKSLVSQPAASLVEWVRRNQWEKRTSYAKVIGMLSNLDKVSYEKTRDAMSVFDPYIKDMKVVNILLDVKNPQLTRLVIDKYGKVLGPSALLKLLDDPDANVRILAIRLLKGYNDVQALKLIIDGYEKEKDAEVRRVYKESFWMLQDRN